jgi:hypothetical protein
MRTRLLKKLRKQFRRYVFIRTIRKENQDDYCFEVDRVHEGWRMVGESYCSNFYDYTRECMPIFCQGCQKIYTSSGGYSNSNPHTSLTSAMKQADCLVECMVLDEVRGEKRHKFEQKINKSWKNRGK